MLRNQILTEIKEGLYIKNNKILLRETLKC